MRRTSTHVGGGAARAGSATTLPGERARGGHAAWAYELTRTNLTYRASWGRKLAPGGEAGVWRAGLRSVASSKAGSKAEGKGKAPEAPTRSRMTNTRVLCGAQGRYICLWTLLVVDGQTGRRRSRKWRPACAQQPPDRKRRAPLLSIMLAPKSSAASRGAAICLFFFFSAAEIGSRMSYEVLLMAASTRPSSTAG